MMHSVFFKSLATALTVAVSGSLLAMQSPAAAGPADEVDDMPGVLTQQEEPLAVGRIVTIDRNARQIEIEHAPIKELYMENMIMVFKVANPNLVYGLTPGDKIRFKVERRGRSYVVTYIENSN